jgi:glutamate N-acetyltransferase/amino-acid N-acetyltransferase
MIKKIKGGLGAPSGFVCGAGSSGIKNPRAPRLDTALVVSELPCAAAGTFTTNVVKAAPVRVSMEHLRVGKPRAILLNSGNANACTGAQGLADARRMAEAAAERAGLKPRDVLVCSTGRIGVPLPMSRIIKGVEALPLSRRNSLDCAKAIMTSDTFAKEIAIEVKTGKGVFRIGGIAKGAGMIDPNMATMLCVITTDAKIPQPALRKALKESVEVSFNRITVDGDMSTNDTVLLLANGASGVTPPAVDFRAALDTVTQTLARLIVKDGEGVTKFVEIELRGAASAKDARRAAEAVANSTLTKCAWAGGDPNWGRIMDALGYSGAKMREEKTAIFYNDLPIVENGVVAKTPWSKLRAIAAKPEFRIVIDMAVGKFSHTVWTTDLTEEYVRLNLGE